MIYFTGDTHGGIDMKKLSNKNMRSTCGMPDQDDYLIILGDFGLPFFDGDRKAPDSDPKKKKKKKKKKAERNEDYAKWMKFLRKKPYTILWLDGNHDNHAFWKKQPVSKMFGGRVQIHPDAKNVIHLLRGEVYAIDGKRIFTFGGAASHDRAYREEGLNWWKEETAQQDEITYAYHNLASCRNQVDYILTHTPPDCVMRPLLQNADKMERYVPDRTAFFLDTLLPTVQYRAWLCGHLHMDTLVPERALGVLYQNVLNEQQLGLI